MRIRIRCPECKATTIVLDAWAEPKGGLYSEPGIETSHEEPRRTPEIRGESSMIAAAVAQLREEDARMLLRELIMVVPSESVEELRPWAEVIATLQSKEPKLIGELIVKALEVRARILAIYGAEMARLDPCPPGDLWPMSDREKRERKGG